MDNIELQIVINTEATGMLFFEQVIVKNATFLSEMLTAMSSLLNKTSNSIDIGNYHFLAGEDGLTLSDEEVNQPVADLIKKFETNHFEIYEDAVLSMV